MSFFDGFAFLWEIDKKNVKNWINLDLPMVAFFVKFYEEVYWI